MTVETFSLSLGSAADGTTVKVKGTTNPNVANPNNTQIVTVLDGGNLGDDDGDGVGATYRFEKWGRATPTESGQGPGGDDEFHFDLSGFDDDFSITVHSMDPGDKFVFTGDFSYVVSGNIWTITYIGSDGAPHILTLDAESDNATGIATVVVCFGAGTMIAVPGGERAVEDIAPGDKVICGDGTARPVRWVGVRHVDEAALKANPKLRPVRLVPDALGDGRPDRALTLSPQHRILLDGWRAELLFGAPQVLTPAISLVNDSTITRDRACGEVTYYHLLMDAHHTVIANGLACESLYPGDMAMSALDGEAREELFAIFPELAASIESYGSICRPVLKPHEARLWARMQGGD